jgi:hypothetical protein
LIVWRDRYPTIHKAVFDAFNKIVINSKRQLTSFTGDVLGKISPYQAFFENVAETIKPELIQEQGRWKLLIPLVMLVRENDQATPIIKAEGKFGFWAEADPTNPDTYLDIKSGAFVADEKISLTVLEDKVSSFGDLISLYIPKGSIFIFSTDPRQPSMTWQPSSDEQKTDTRIAIRIPATEKTDLKESENGRFTFEMEKFALGTAGFDLKGAVRVENILLGEDPNVTGFKEPLAIKGVERKGNENEQKELKIGEIEFRQSKLVGGSLQAVAKLIYFDDAIATFSLAVSQVDNTLAVAGTVDITGLSEFHVDALFSTFEISLLHLETTYKQRNGSRSWQSRGAMTGQIKFLPPKGRSSSEMGALASLFDGVTVKFENLDPVKMDAEKLEISFLAKRFEFASIFMVDLRGIIINPEGNKGGFKILGDINIQRLPGVESQFTFGGITLTPVYDENRKAKAPEFSISSIGAELSIPGGPKICPKLFLIKNEQEVEFGGKVTIKSEALGKLDGLIKVTRLRTPDGYIPSLAIYFQKDLDVSLFAGFFLRNIGVGLGINQALNGLERKDLPLPQRIITLVNSPNGLPDPEFLESWIPNPPDSNQINWMLVAAGLITFGKLPPDVEHPIAGRIILAIDQDLDIVAGVNVWLFSSPNQTQQRQFIERPVARGAIAISPKEQQVFGLFRTVKNPQLTPKVPALLAEVLNKIDTSLMFVGDQNGFLLEVGWPWETKINYSIGILRGILTSGFRFGIYRGVTSFGLNFAIDIILSFQLGIEFSIGPLKLGAFLSISGKGYFRCSFIGALTPNFTPYLLGNVQLAATVAVKGSAYVKFSAKICGVRIRKTLLDISFNINISLSAVLTAALERTDLGFQGSARVVVGVGGYSFEGNVAIEYEPKRIKPVEDKLNELLPRRVAPTSFALMQSLEIPLLELEETEAVWNYQVYRVQNQVRILLFPKPGQDYPDVSDNSESGTTDIKKSRFQINLIDSKRFQGFLGSSSLDPGVAAQPGLELQESIPLIV